MEKGIERGPLLKTRFEEVWKDILLKAGYNVNITIHAVRRGLGKKLDGKSSPIA